ncbi:unnamed protein product [Effrenium voratum]|uniref:Uncharacterized protein n=1 Tax=Effrenium voratum TaxID=2562239 RepID=A0AA36NHD4_9DINO|nr:unnamed protein product [Effrenium voratum]
MSSRAPTLWLDSIIPFTCGVGFGSLSYFCTQQKGRYIKLMGRPAAAPEMQIEPCQQRSNRFTQSKCFSWKAPKPEFTATLCLLQTASCTCPKCRLECRYITWHCLEGQIRFQEGPRAF